MDGDDWLESDFVEYMLRLVNETGSDMGFSDKIFTTYDREQTINDVIETWTSEDATAAILYPHMRVGPWSKIYKTDMLRKYNITFSVKWFGEGLHFAATAAQHSNHVGVGHRKVYNYRLDNMNSGLSNYDVSLALNALENINIIRQQLIIRTPKVERAAQWHIWANYHFVLRAIIATNTKNEYLDLYKDCIKNIRSRLIKTVIESDLGLMKKLKMLIEGVFPIQYAKYVLGKKRC